MRVVGPGNVAVTCWCERQVVAVPLAEVWAGATRSCGARECRAKARTA